MPFHVTYCKSLVSGTLLEEVENGKNLVQVPAVDKVILRAAKHPVVLRASSKDSFSATIDLADNGLQKFLGKLAEKGVVIRQTYNGVEYRFSFDHDDDEDSGVFDLEL